MECQDDFIDWLVRHKKILERKFEDMLASPPHPEPYPYQYADWCLNQYKLCQLFQDTSP